MFSISKVFQFLQGTVQTVERCITLARSRYFNSSKVRYKPVPLGNNQWGEGISIPPRYGTNLPRGQKEK